MADSPPPSPPPFPATPAIPLTYPAPATPIPHAFTPDHVAAIAEARKRFAPIRREIGVAAFYAWSVAVFAVLTILFSLTSPAALLVGLGMTVFAFIQFKALARLRNLDPTAPRTLALNHVLLASLLILYALYCLFLAPPSSVIKEALASSPDLASADPALAQSLDQMVRLVMTLLYGGVLLFGLLVEGGWALYHHSRTKHLRHYLDTTAPWLLQLHHAGALK